MLRLLFDQKTFKNWVVDGLTTRNWSPLTLKDLPDEEVVWRAGVLVLAGLALLCNAIDDISKERARKRGERLVDELNATQRT